MTHTPYIADLHIHSRYSRATSKASDLFGLAAWAAIKGIDVVGTGDFTHPGWFAHLHEHLEPAEPGFFKLKNKLDPEPIAPILPPGVQPDTSGIRFVLTSEISSIYKRGGKVRKVHNLLFAPDFAAVRKINTTLAGIGNLESDGRPILGLDSKLLLEILLENAPQGFLVPAHIWTPWFSLFGSKSGFDAIEECFGDLSSEIFALETGLSSDPEMNRCISALDRFSLISNSDCHSPSKLGRESNIFTTGFDFPAMQEAIRNPVDKDGKQHFTATIEFYPEEGKYHCDGHRKCGVCFEPAETVREKGICPQCGKPLTIGVLYRVLELADRDQPLYPVGSPAVHSLVPLPELLSELFNVGPASKKIAGIYGKLINRFGSEFTLLMDTPIEDIKETAPMLAMAVERVRNKRVIRKPGFDGEFGVIKVFEANEKAELGGQLSLFGQQPSKLRKKKDKNRPIFKVKKRETRSRNRDIKKLNQQQQAVVDSEADCILVKAGPGTGKTHTLVQRVIRLLDRGENIPVTIITFTNKAAHEIRERLHHFVKKQQPVRVDTFHGLCLEHIREYDSEITLVGPEMRTLIIRRVYPALSKSEQKNLRQEISIFLTTQAIYPEKLPDSDSMQPFFNYLRKEKLLDLDEVVPACTALLHRNSLFAQRLRKDTGHLLVDEFQDLNAAQYELVHILAQSNSIFGIGDPDQAIYGFRGSDPAWFKRFIEKEQPELHYLSINYRSASHILEAAASVIAPNHIVGSKRKNSETKATIAASEKTGVIYQYQGDSEQAEAAFIAEQIQQLLGGTSHREIDQVAGSDKGLALSDIAVLYRTGQQAAVIAKALADRVVSCQLVNLTPFYQTGESRILYYWMLLASERIDKAQLLFLFGQEKGIGKMRLHELEWLIPDNSSNPFAEIIAHCDNHDNVSQQTRAVVLKIRDLLTKITTIARRGSTADVVDRLLEQYDLDSEEPDLVRFRQLALSSPSLETLADHLRKHANSVIYDDRAEAVLLSTLHAAKGLEFKAVFIAGCEEGLLPLAPHTQLSGDALKKHGEEERRLFFVGMTRAAEVLYLTGAETRYSFKGKEKQEPSSLLADIPAHLISHPATVKKKRKTKSSAKQLRLF